MAKELSIEEQVAQQVAELNRQFELKQEQRELNEVRIGARVVIKRIQLGSPVIDKDTREQKVVNGVPQTYASKYFVTIQFMGSALEAEVSSETYDSLEEMRTYLCEGYIGEVKRYGTPYIEPIFRKFTQI